MTPDADIDLSGLRCPLPVLRTKKALADMTPGQRLRVFSTDPESQNDIPAFVKMAGHALLQNQNHNNGFVFLIQKK